MQAQLAPPATTLPSRRATAILATKVTMLRLRRGLRDFGRGPARLKQGPCGDEVAVVSESRTPLWSDPTPGERRHQLGKVQNLRRAAHAFDGLVIPAGATFSFWRQLGRASHARGFVDGRMLQAGCTVVERHAHSRRVGPASAGRDAIVAWNYVDLRCRPAQTVQLRAPGLPGRRGRHRASPCRSAPDQGDCLVVAQSFLPHLWRAGHLGERRFSVLMTWPPLAIIQARLNAAFAAHLDRATLADYRTDPTLVQREAEALAAAEQLITPHAEIASLFPGHSLQLGWRRPALTSAARPDRLSPSRGQDRAA